MRGAVLVLAIVMAACAAQAQRVSNVKGATLLQNCTGPSTLACDAYVDGFGDAIEAEGKASAVACIPPSVTGTELRDVLVKFLKDHPEHQHEKASKLAKQAFGKAYPCGK
jgi:hypothetical protein